MPYKWKERREEYHKEYHKEWYQKNKEKVRKAADASNARKLEWFRKLKDKYSCEQCGSHHAAIIEFHHRDPKQKDFMLAKYKSRSKEKILAEIEKCTPLCRNCHAILHWEQRQNSGSNPVAPSRECKDETKKGTHRAGKISPEAQNKRSIRAIGKPSYGVSGRPNRIQRSHWQRIRNNSSGGPV